MVAEASPIPMSASELPFPTSSPFPRGSAGLRCLGALALPSSHQQVPCLASPLQPSASEPPAQIYCHTLKPRLSARVSVSRWPLIDLFYLPLAKALWPQPPRWHKGLPKALGSPLAHPGPT